MDYGVPERRKNRNDKKAKSRFNKYKLCGRFRSVNLNANNVADQDKK